ncbi:MAG TPA: hypothetical protein PKG67_06750 [Turneriella sp.]|nr:hypothetical protein [Turneriella sp.]HNE18998.1 hypothetical protein [Turneriella sp.]HNL53108.1 hypothetical protein [Turneriella sp.]HNN00134.1 hypothetical protein [Turneriella sp.]
MPQKLLQVVMLACLVGGAALAADTRRKAIRREMIEMDIAVRNLTSTIAMADRKVLDDSLQRLVTWQIKDHPDLGAAFRQVLADWQSKNLSRYGTELQKEAQALRSFAAGRAGRLSDSDWAKIGSGLNRILINCQNCHEAARKEPK